VLSGLPQYSVTGIGWLSDLFTLEKYVGKTLVNQGFSEFYALILF